eukprot:ANDGO_06062.mRNA.1 hypothetical protein
MMGPTYVTTPLSSTSLRGLFIGQARIKAGSFVLPAILSRGTSLPHDAKVVVQTTADGPVFSASCYSDVFNENHGLPDEPVLIRCITKVPDDGLQRNSTAKIVIYGQENQISWSSPPPPSPPAAAESPLAAQGIAAVLPVLFGTLNCHAVQHWMDYAFLRLQVDHVFAYTESVPVLCEEAMRDSRITVVSIPGISTFDMWYKGQLFIMHDALLRVYGYFQWVGFFDLDEYLVLPPDSSTNLASYLKKTHADSGKLAFSFGSRMAAVDPCNVVFNASKNLWITETANGALDPNAECQWQTNTPEMCISWMGRRKMFVQPLAAERLNIHEAHPGHIFEHINAHGAHIRHYRGCVQKCST